MKPLTRMQSRAALVTITASLLLLSATPLLTQTPRCPHVMLFTAPAHGSSWFLRSVESCVNNTADVKPSSALPASTRLTRSLRFTKVDLHASEWLAHIEAPVVVLRRDVPGAYRQFVEAGGVMDWVDWERSVDSFFTDVEALLKDGAIRADWVWYNDVVAKKRFYLDHASCFVDNCISFPE